MVSRFVLRIESFVSEVDLAIIGNKSQGMIQIKKRLTFL